MKLLADSVSDIASDNGEAVLLNIGLNRVTYIADTVSWLRLGDAPPEALSRYVNSALILPQGKVFALSPWKPL